MSRCRSAVSKEIQDLIHFNVTGNPTAQWADQQIAKLIFAVVLINAWNRLGVADHLPFAVEAQPVLHHG